MKELWQSLLDTRRVWRAFGYSLKGLQAAYTGESAFRQELILTVVLVPFALWVGRTGTERSLLIGSVLLVLIVELLNSAVEATVDRGGRDWDKQAGRAKDMGSAAVLMAFLLAAVTWGLLLWDRLGG